MADRAEVAPWTWPEPWFTLSAVVVGLAAASVLILTVEDYGWVAFGWPLSVFLFVDLAIERRLTYWQRRKIEHLERRCKSGGPSADGGQSDA